MGGCSARSLVHLYPQHAFLGREPRQYFVDRLWSLMQFSSWFASRVQCRIVRRAYVRRLQDCQCPIFLPLWPPLPFRQWINRMFLRMGTSARVIACLYSRLVKAFQTGETTGLLRVARHAVVTTLYSRAHRIGLDGASCLLRSLGKSASLVLVAGSVAGS